ncbi:MAG TPA: hypothetical protein VMI55_08755 [Thermoplasmata archaeon]|nr:hypothetical protein [Thermoplasmata archaeon]
MSASSPDLGRRDRFEDRTFSDLASDPQFRVVVDQVQAEKKAALADPGPSWKEWALHSALKWYIGLGLLIVDGWVVDFWLIQGTYLGFVTLVPLLYAEYLLWQYLWHRPQGLRTGHRAPRRWVWVHPVRFGRWTPEADLARKGELVPADQPSPAEFL